jgi:hypothetical protein
MSEEDQMKEIERQAEELARANCEAEPTISEVWWFPHGQQVRLIEVDSTSPIDPDGKIHPFHFRPSPADGLPAPSDIAVIHPDERDYKLPDGWGEWDTARQLK